MLDEISFDPRGPALPVRSLAAPQSTMPVNSIFGIVAGRSQRRDPGLRSTRYDGV